MMSTVATQRQGPTQPLLVPISGGRREAGAGRRRAEVTRPAPDFRLPPCSPSAWTERIKVMFQPVHLTVVPEAAQVELGGQLTLSLTIRNASRMGTVFRIDVSGIPRDWYDLDQTRASLAPSSHERVHLTVHPTAGAATLAGSYAITVHVTAEDDPTNHASTVVALTVDSGAWLDMSVQPAEVEGREATFRITFVNRSHTPVPVRLAASDREDRLSFRIEPDDTVIVPAGAAADSITVHVVPKVRETVGKPHHHQLEFRGLLLGSEHASNPYLVGQARFTHAARYAARWQPA